MPRRGKHTRDDLIDVATVLFARRGFSGVSLQEIAKELGISKQALLHHFPRKEVLFWPSARAAC